MSVWSLRAALTVPSVTSSPARDISRWQRPSATATCAKPWVVTFTRDTHAD
jgi:hypothetical protein